MPLAVLVTLRSCPDGGVPAQRGSDFTVGNATNEASLLRFAFPCKNLSDSLQLLAILSK